MPALLDTNKAGLQKLNMPKIEEKLAEDMDSDEEHALYDAERDTSIKRQQQFYQQQAKKLSKVQLEKAQEAVDSVLRKVPEPPEMHYYALCDLDCFFCACETHQNPSFAGIPMAVGHDLGVISAANYEARRYGVRSGQATFQARKLCPTLTLVKPNMKMYVDISHRIVSLLQENFDPNLQTKSIDEVCADITPHVHREVMQLLDERQMLPPLAADEGLCLAEDKSDEWIRAQRLAQHINTEAFIVSPNLYFFESSCTETPHGITPSQHFTQRPSQFHASQAITPSQWTPIAQPPIRQANQLQVISLRTAEQAGNPRSPVTPVTPTAQSNDIGAYVAVITAKLYQEAAAIVARRMRALIRAEIGLTMSVGVATNRHVAKVAADVNKPDGQTVIAPGRRACQKFLSKLPIRKLFGVGPVTAAILGAPPFSAKTVGDIWRSRGLVHLLLTPALKNHLLHMIAAINDNDGPGEAQFTMLDDGEGQSVGSERTFQATADFAFLSAVLTELTRSVCRRLYRASIRAGAIVIKIKTTDFHVHQRRIRLQAASADSKVLLSAALTELPRICQGIGVRLDANVRGIDTGVLGIRLIGLRAVDLLGEKEDFWAATRTISATENEKSETT